MKQGGRSRSSLFLMEQIVVIAVFAFCAAVTVYIMAAAHQMSADAVDTRYALLMAENAAEVHKASAGSVSLVSGFLGGTLRTEVIHEPGSIPLYWNYALTIYFDAQWLPTSHDEAAFILELEQTESDDWLMFADISVRRVRDDEVLVQFTTAARHGGGRR